MDDYLRISHTLSSTSATVREYKGTDAIKAVDAMLTALADRYKCELADVNVDQLIALQSRLRQTLAIRDVIRGDQQLPTI